MQEALLGTVFQRSARLEGGPLPVTVASLPSPQLTQGSGMDIEQGITKVPLRRRLKILGPLASPILLQAFTLTFLAEWGDRSQLTTIILGAREVCTSGRTQGGPGS